MTCLKHFNLDSSEQAVITIPSVATELMSPTPSPSTTQPLSLTKEETAQIMNFDNLQRGIEQWLTHPIWATDFHGQLYLDLQQLFEPELNEAHWQQLVEILWTWRAIRPLTKKQIYEQGRLVLPRINQLRQELLQKQPPTWENYEWAELEPLFETAKGIKGTNSPVFASKLAHFCLPAVFPVIDREFIGVKESYASYWQRCRQLWQNTGTEFQQTAQAKLKEFLTAEKQPNFPYAPKITELCLSALPKK